MGAVGLFSHWWAVLLLLAAVAGFIVCIHLEDRRVARELARRPLREFQVAGLDRDRVVSRHATWGPVPLLTRRDLRRLDEARRKLERFEAEQARGDG